MKLRTEERTIESGGVVGSRQFSIKMDGHMMALLSGLYSDIPWAIVREYWSNAEDGHAAFIAMGNTPAHPITVHVPNRLEPWFAVRDYGVGMDHDTVFEIYTQYGNSTKNASNAQKGGFGIGAKAAFCYPDGADQWTVESWFEGMHRSYIAAKDEHGMPTLQLMLEVESDASNGIQIKIPVAQKDLELFVAAIRKFSRRRTEHAFEIVGDKAGVDSQEYEAYTYTTRTSLYGWRPAGSGERGVMAVMGGVPYPVDLHTADLNLDSVTIQHLGQQGSVDLFFDIGELDIVPSREGLMYTPNTVAKLLTRFPNMFEDRIRTVMAEMQQCKTHWEAVKFCDTNSSALAMARSSLGGNTNVEWNGKPIAKDTPYEIDLDVLNSRLPNDAQVTRVIHLENRYSNMERQADIVPLSSIPVSPDGTLNLFQGTGGNKVRTVCAITLGDYTNSVINPGSSPFVIADTKPHVSLFESWVKSKKTYASLRDYYLFVGENLTISDLEAGLDGIRISSLDAQTQTIQQIRNAKKLSTKVPASLQVLNGNYWITSEVDLSKGGYYVPLNRDVVDEREVPTEFGRTDLRKLTTMLTILKSQGMFNYTSETIIGIPRTRLKRIKTLANWKSLWDHIKPEVIKLCNRAIPDTPEDPKLLEHSLTKLDSLKVNEFLKHPDSKLFKRLEKAQNKRLQGITSYKVKLEEFQAIATMRKLVTGTTTGKTLKRPPKGVDVKPLIDYDAWMKTRYPLVFVVGSRYSWERTLEAHRAAFVNYISMVDKTTPVRNAPKI